MPLLLHTGSVLVNFTSLPTRILLRSAAAVKQAGRRSGARHQVRGRWNVQAASYIHPSSGMCPARNEKAGSWSVNLQGTRNTNPWVTDNRLGLAYSADDLKTPWAEISSPWVRENTSAFKIQLARPWSGMSYLSNGQAGNSENRTACLIESLSHIKCISRNRPLRARGEGGECAVYLCAFSQEERLALRRM